MLPMDGLHFHGEVSLCQNDRLIPIRIELKPKADILGELLLIQGRVRVPLLVDIMSATLVVYHLLDTMDSRTRRNGWSQHKLSESVHRDVFIVIIMVIWCMSLLGMGTVTLLGGSTRCSWRNGAATTMWVLSASAHLPLPLGNGDIIVGALLSHLLSFTSHLRRCGNEA
jgi:hypothetical protein